MKNLLLIILISGSINAQSGRAARYSESESRIQVIEKQTPDKPETKPDAETDFIRVETDLVTIPVRITQQNGKPVPDVRKEEFRIFENGIEQEIAYFSNEEQPFTVALVLDMSYSSVFKLSDIQAAALSFVNQLRNNDRVMVVSFDEKVHVLCGPTNDRKVLKLAIEGSEIASGTSIYAALDLVLEQKLKSIAGRKAVVILSDGVDTSSQKITASNISNSIAETGVLVYPVQYNTFDDVQKSRRENAEVGYDDNDRPYAVDAPRIKGERAEDYEKAREFFKDIADLSGGRVYRVSSKTNLAKSFADIANELRKIYSLGYYPSGERKSGVEYDIRVRVYRPGLVIRTNDTYPGSNRPKRS